MTSLTSAQRSASQAAGRAFSLLRATAIAATVAAIASVPAQADAIKLNMVGSWAPGVSEDADIALRFMEEVNKNAAGKLEIVYKGSKEVVPTFDQPEALVRGVFDVWYGAPNYWAGILSAGYVTELALSDIPDHGPGSPLFEFMSKMYAEKGVKYLGHYSGDSKTGSHYIHLKKEIKSIDDLKGMKIRVPPLTRFFVSAVGAEPVTLPPGEVYVAMERGTVDGFSWPYFDGFTNFGWQEVTKYVVDAPLYRNGITIHMNMKKWDSLPADVQKNVIDAIAPTQQWALGWVAAHQAVQLKGMLAGGMKKIELSDEDREKWAKTAHDALWNHFKSNMSAEDFASVTSMMGYEN